MCFLVAGLLDDECKSHYREWEKQRFGAAGHSPSGTFVLFPMKSHDGCAHTFMISREVFDQKFSKYFKLSSGDDVDVDTSSETSLYQDVNKIDTDEKKNQENENENDVITPWKRTQIVNNKVPPSAVQRWLLEIFSNLMSTKDMDKSGNNNKTDDWFARICHSNVKNGDFDNNSKHKCYIWDLYDLNMPSTLVNVEKNVILLGDAAHASLPTCACGVGNGFEDIYYLVKMMKEKFLIDTVAANSGSNEQTNLNIDMNDKNKKDIIQELLKNFNEKRYNQLKTVHDNTRKAALSFSSRTFKMNKLLVPKLPQAIFNDDVNQRLKIFIDEEKVVPKVVSWKKPCCYLQLCCLVFCAIVAICVVLPLVL